MSSASGQLGVLLRADARRLAALARRPSVALWLGLVLPVVLLAVGVRAAGSFSGAALRTTQDGVTLGVLLSGPIAFVAYTTLFRGGDDSFLRRLGVAPGALYGERALRLLVWGAALGGLAALAYAGAGVPPGRLAAVAGAAVFAAWGAALLSFSVAARAMAGRQAGEGWGCLTAGMWDREVAGAAPLVYAPLPPLMAGALAGGVAAGVGEAAAMVAGAVVALAIGAAGVAARAYRAALPRFGPQALEMSFAPPPGSDGDGLRRRRGLARLLPRRAAAAWARDGAVASRRFAWATRITWPVVAFSLVALARWGTDPDTRGWVASAAVFVLVLQGAAAIGLGRLERRGARWVDRAVGVTPAQRFLGRWAWGWGASLWLAVPLSLAWSWWAGAGPGWPWVVAGAGTSGVAALASGFAAGRR